MSRPIALKTGAAASLPHCSFLGSSSVTSMTKRGSSAGGQEPAALAWEADAGRRPETERAHVAVEPIAPEGEAHLDRAHVRRVLQHLAERQPAVLLPVVDRGLRDGE